MAIQHNSQKYFERQYCQIKVRSKWLIQDGENLFGGNKKLQEEYYLIVGAIVVKEFYNNAEDTFLFQQLIQLYQTQFNSHVLNSITQIFETGDDDRFCKFVPQIMPKTLLYLQQMRESKLLFLVWQMLQHTQWSVGTDQETLEKCLNIDILRQIMQQLLTVNYVSLNPLNQIENDVSRIVQIQTLLEKRYSAKILTLLFREFMTTKKLKPEAQKFTKDVYLLSLKNLLYLLPFYLTTYTFNQSLDDLDQDYVSEFQALVVQIFSLMSTILSLHSKIVLKDLKHLNEILIIVMFQYCIEGIQYEKTYNEDPNIFLVEFLESGDDYENLLSIRSTVCDFIEEACQHTDFNRATLEKVIASFVQDQFSVTPEMSNIVFEKLKIIQEVSQLNEIDDLFVLPGYSVMKYEVAFFIIGQSHEMLNIPTQLIDQSIKILSDPEPQVLLKLRSLWLLEKLCSSSVIRKQKDSIGRQIFQIISDLFVNQSEFVLNYQCIKTLHRFIKLIDIKKSYPLNYIDMLCIFMQKVSQIIPLCKDETIHFPLETLSFLSKIDQDACCRVVEQVMPGVMELYSKYYQDGMIGPDIVDLIKLWARLPNNQAFAQLFLPQNMLSILTSYILQTRHRELNQESLDIIKYLFMMELEILNASKDIHINIYTILSLSSFVQAVPNLGSQYTVQITTVLKKILNIPGGLDESSLLYVGHFILNLVQNGDLDSETQQKILLVLVRRLAKSQVPSTTKFLLKNSDINDIKNMIQNWISYLTHFQDSFSKEISKRGLIYLLEYSKNDINFAGLKIHLNEFSKQEVLLQTKLVRVLGRELIYQAEFNKSKKDSSKNEFSDGDDDDYEDEDVSDDDASVEENDDVDAKGGTSSTTKKKKYGGTNFDEDFGDMDALNASFGGDGAHAAENQDEEHLLSPFLQKFTEGQADAQTLARITIKSLGRETLIKIVNTVTEDGDSLFSKSEQEVLLQL